MRYGPMLVCTKCGERYDLSSPIQRCPRCGEPLQLDFARGSVRKGRSVWSRFGDFYPDVHLNMDYSMGEGDTPLLFSRRISRKLGNDIYLKNESQNPTWSFKDRGTFVALNRAISLGFEKIGVVSTGNMAASVSAYGARAGLETYVLLHSDTSMDRMAQISVYGSKVILVEGDYGTLYYESIGIGTRDGIYFMNSDDPFRVEGYKSIAFEIGETVETDYVVIPTSSGGLLRGIMKGFEELRNSGIIDRIPVPVAVQAEGCAPICRAFHNGTQVERFDEPRTIAHAISNPYPPSGNEVLRLLKRYGGTCISVSDEDIINAQMDLAHEGIFVQPASATVLAAVTHLKVRGKKIVLVLTGSGLKAKMEYHGLIYQCELKDLERLLEVIKNES